MARHRWTLALFLICPLILATVITAFRVRDLPKTDDSENSDRKQKCDNCNVKFSQIPHSAKTESDKYVYEDINKPVREKSQQIPQKPESKSSLNFDESYEEDDYLNSLKVKSITGIKKEASNRKYTTLNYDDEDNSSERSILLKKKNLLEIKKIDQDLKNTKSKDIRSKVVNFDKKASEGSDLKDNIQHVAKQPIASVTQKEDYKRKETENNIKIVKPLIIKDSNDGSVRDKNNIKTHDIKKPILFEIKKSDDKLKPSQKGQGVTDSMYTPDKKETNTYYDDTNDSSDYDDNDDDDNNDNNDDDIDDEDDENNYDDDGDDDNDDDDDGLLSTLWETFSVLGLDLDLSLKMASKNEGKENTVIIQKQETGGKNSDKDKYKLDTKTIPKVEDSKKILNHKSVRSKTKEAVSKESFIKIMYEDSDDDDDDDDYDDDMDNRFVKKLEQKVEHKTTFKKKASILPKSKDIIITKSAYVNSYEDNDDEGDIVSDDDNFNDNGRKFNTISKEKNMIISPLKKNIKLKNNIDHGDINDDYDTNDNHTYTNEGLTHELKTKIGTKGKNGSLQVIIKTSFKENQEPDKNNNEDNDNSIGDNADLTVKKSISGKSIKQEDKIKKTLSSQTKDATIKDLTKNAAETKIPEKKIKKENLADKIDKEVKFKEKDDQIINTIKDKIENSDKSFKKEENKKETKNLEVKSKLEIKNVNEGKETKSKDTKEKSHPEDPSKEEKKGIPSSGSTKDYSEEGLNIPEIKKEIKAQIKSSRENKIYDKTSKEKRDSSEKYLSSENHLKHLTDALHRRNLLKSEFEDFYAFFPTFAPNFSRIHNPECRRHGQIVLRQLRGTKLWALNMLDATAKIPSGILQGNGIQLGDFDQCIHSRARVRLEGGSVVKVQGKYCLARIDVKAEHPELEAPVQLAQAKNLIRSRIDDPGHFVPRFSTLSWGVCMPDVCNPEDVELVIKDAIKHYQKISGVIVRVKVDKQDCQIKEMDWWKDWIELPTILTLAFYGICILLVLVATLQDFFTTRTDVSQETKDGTESTEETVKAKTELNIDQHTDGFLSSFSLYNTIDKLVAPGTTDDISCIHGIRAIATVALLIAHKFLPVAGMPYTNRLKITEVASSPLFSWCRAGWMFTDCFLLISGTLTAYKTSDNDSGAPKRLLSKYLRLTPALLAVVLFYAYIWDNISNGPMWGTFVTKNAQICQEGWWWNLLYVQNYFGLEDMCAPQTHQLALDMQLTVVGSVLLWVMQIKGVYRFILPALHIAAAYSRYTTVRDHRLTMLAYHGVSVSQLYRTARLSYTSILHRSTPYLIGISLGLALKNPPEHGKFLLGVGWLSSIALWCLVWWAGADSGSTQYRYQIPFAAQYAALAPIASALAIAWVIYAVHSGRNGGFLTSFLCCRPLVLISRLSYAVYLTQFVVYFTNIATVKTSSEFTLMSMIDIKEILAITLSSVILTLTLVTPVQSLHKIFTFSTIFEVKKKNSRDSIEFVENNNEKELKQENHKLKELNNVEVPQMKTRQHLIAHREVLEEIPETEVEYESQRDTDRLGEILEEEEDEDMGEESVGNLDIDDDLEIIEEEEGGEDEIDESISNRRQYTPRRSYSNEDEQDLNEWEWTTNGSRNGAQYYRYSR